MHKLVYLFELDSYRKTDNEIAKAIHTMYNEIVVNGNIVVLTFNQLVESRCMLSLFSEPEYSEDIADLFLNGAIRLSQFGNIRTPAQYLIGALGSTEPYIFSGFPLKSNQKALLALTKRCLINSDLSEIKEYLDSFDINGTKIRNEKDLNFLFREVDSCNKDIEISESKLTRENRGIKESI